jgi:Siphovirus Gp157
MSLDLTLYQIENDLLDLIQMREQTLEEADGVRALVGSQSQEYADALYDVKVLDGQIAEYVKAEIRKADNIGALWRHFTMMRDAAKAEAKRLDQLAKGWESRLDRLKAVCQAAMETFEWRAGKPRVIEGRTTKLYLKANGGRPAVEISNSELIPDEFQRITAEMSGDVWEEIVKYFGPVWVKEKMGRVTKAPALSLIGEALERGPVAGCRLAERASHVECK